MVLYIIITLPEGCRKDETETETETEIETEIEIETK